MYTYVGYGFNISDIADEDWVALVKKYDSEEFEEIKKRAMKFISDPEDAEEIIIDYVSDFIDENSMSKADYLTNIINAGEKEAAGTDYIVSTYDDFLVFDNVRFADDSKRTQYVRTQEDFLALINKYVPIEHITFGNLYEGVEWIDPAFFLD